MRLIRFLLGAICGGVVGAFAALCLAPMSGKDLRAVIFSELKHLVEDVQQAVADKRSELSTNFGSDS